MEVVVKEIKREGKFKGKKLIIVYWRKVWIRVWENVIKIKFEFVFIIRIKLS